MTYPATNLNEAVGLIVPDSNALHNIINGGADDTIITPEGREVPTVLKAMADSLLFKDPITWEEGTLEQDPLQLRTFTDGLIYWAPTAQSANPVAMGVSPIGDSNWKISPLAINNEGLIRVFDTVVDMKAAIWLQVGQLVETKGYHSAGDGGQAHYLIQTSNEFGDTPDEYGNHTLSNGNVAVLQVGGVVNVKRFGAVGDGVVDDTTSVIAAHTYANTVFTDVSYAGCTQIALQANAQIPLQTSVDYAGCQLVILGGINTTPSFSTFNNLYIVTDPACPLVTVTGSVLVANLTAGSLFPTLGLFNGHGYAFLECGFQIPNRTETGTTNYQQAFKINRNGRASLPLSVDISAFSNGITVTYRKTSERRITIKNVSLMEGDWNNQRVFYIQRCNVEVNNFTLMFTGGTFNNIQNIIKIEHGSDITIRNFISTGQPVTTFTGSYNLDIFGGADIIVDNMNALTGWGATGTNHLNGIKFVNCVLNRLDAHGGGHNVFAENCELHESGMVYGWGGGVLSVKGCRLNNCNAISTRGDYGGQFFGDLVVSDCETTSNQTATMLVVDLEANPLGASTPVHAPRTITVTNVTRSSAASTTGTTEFIPVRIRIKDASSVVYAPNIIKVDNVNYHRNWRSGLRIDTLNMESSPIFGGIMQVVCSNIFPTVGATSTSGILDYPSIRTPSAPVQPFFFISDCDNIHLSCQSENNAQIRISDCSINAVSVNTVAAVQPNVMIRDCRLLTTASGYSPTVPVGGARSGGNNCTTIMGCDIYSSPWDLSLISAAQGNTIRNGSITPTLPSGVAPVDIFTGWRAAGAFQS